MFGKSIEELQASLDRLAAKELELIARQRDASARAAAIELEVGATLLDATPDSPPADESVDQLARARASIAGIEAALRAAVGRRLEIVRALRAAKADALHKQAADLLAQREKLLSRVEKHMTAISELQGMPCVAMPVVNFGGPRPLTSALEGRAMTVELEAATFEIVLPDQGTIDVEGTDVIPLLQAVLRFEGEVPSSADVLRWAGAVEREPQPRADAFSGLGLSRERSGIDFGQHPRRFHLRWQGGRIDYAESTIQVPALARFTPGYLVGSDVFKAKVA